MKRLLAVLLCMTILLSSAVFVASAEEEAATPTTYIYEGFEDDEVGPIANAVSYRGVKEIFHDSHFYNRNATLEIVEDGYKGKAFKATNDLGDGPFELGLIEAQPTADAPVYLNFKLKVVNDVNGTASMPIMLAYDSLVDIKMNNGKTVLWPLNDSKKDEGCLPRMPYEQDQWYDFRIKFSVDRVDVEIEDENGNITKGYNGNSSKRYIVFKAAPNSGKAVVGTSIMIDELTMIQGTEDAAMKLLSKNYGEVPVNTTTVVNETFDGDTFKNVDTAALNSLGVYLVKSGNFIGSINDNGTGSDSYIGMYSNGTGTSNFTYTVADDCNGGKCPELTVGASKKLNFTTKSATFEEGKAFASARFKIIDDGRDTHASGVSGADIFQLGFGQSTQSAAGGYDLMIRRGYFEAWKYWDQKKAPYTFDVWYTVVFEFEKVNGVNQVTLHVYDDEDKKILYAEPSATQASMVTTPIEVARMAFKTYGVAAEQKFAFDDIKVIQTDAVDSERFIKTEILGQSAPDTIIYTSTPVFKAQFDQVVAPNSVAKYVAQGKEDVDATIRYKGANYVEIVPSTPLDYGTAYTLDISGIKGLGGAGLATDQISSYILNIAPYSIGTMELGTALFEGTEMVLPVTFTNANVGKLNVKLIAALYDGNKVVWVQSKNVVDAKMGQNTFTFYNLPDNAEQLELKIFAWDNFVSIKPLYK